MKQTLAEKRQSLAKGLVDLEKKAVRIGKLRMEITDMEKGKPKPVKKPVKPKKPATRKTK